MARMGGWWMGLILCLGSFPEWPHNYNSKKAKPMHVFNRTCMCTGTRSTISMPVQEVHEHELESCTRIPVRTRVQYYMSMYTSIHCVLQYRYGQAFLCSPALDIPLHMRALNSSSLCTRPLAFRNTGSRHPRNVPGLETWKPGNRTKFRSSL